MRYFVTFAFLFVCGILTAQPGDETIKAQIGKNYNAGDILSLQLSPGGGRTEKELINGSQTNVYTRGYTIKTKTNYPGINQVYSASVIYRQSGSAWNFIQETVGSSVYDGIPNPSEEEIVAHLNTHLRGYLGWAYNKIVGEISPVRLSADPKWNWHTMNSVSFLTEVEYTYITSYTELTTSRNIIEVRLYRAENGKEYDATSGPVKKGGWLPVQEGNCTRKDEKIISKKTYTSDEIDNMKTLSAIDAEKAGKEELSALPEVELPAFTTAHEFIWFLHNRLRTGSADHLKALMYQVLSDDHFEKGNRVVLNEDGKNVMELITHSGHLYKDLFCEFPAVKESGTWYLVFYDRKKYRHVRYVADQVNDQWRILGVNFYVPSVEEINELKGLGDTNCGTDPMTKKENNGEKTVAVSKASAVKFEPGDKVVVNWNAEGKNYYKGEVKKQDPHNENRYFVEFETIQSAWVPSDWIEKNSSADNEKPKTNGKGTSILNDAKSKVKLPR